MTPIDPVSLVTPRLYLRVPTDADTHGLLALYGDREVMRHWSHPVWTCPEQAHAAIAEAQTDLARGSGLHMVIVSRSDGGPAGSCALFDIHPQHRRATLGYLLARPYWGQGLAGEAVRALLAYGFDTLDLVRIEAEVIPGNDASTALLARLGFRCEGLLRARWRVDEQAIDVQLWALLRPDRTA
ncbi:GNAT family N-acetyltransferase [Oxalobacteraceae sp. CFBP 8763]|nr:GNAT family N-acetyltransferase [Oxalobacteraceae sp. CFBP 8763]